MASKIWIGLSAAALIALGGCAGGGGASEGGITLFSSAPTTGADEDEPTVVREADPADPSLTLASLPEGSRIYFTEFTANSSEGFPPSVPTGDNSFVQVESAGVSVQFGSMTEPMQLPAGLDNFSAQGNQNGQLAAISADGGLAAFSYMNWGLWSLDGLGSDAPEEIGAFHYGLQTPTIATPTSGSFTYTGAADLYVAAGSAFQPLNGDATLSVDFGARTVNGAITGLTIVDEGVLKPYYDFGIDAEVFGDTFRGFVTASATPIDGGTGDPYTDTAGRYVFDNQFGRLDGQFYGPAAEELGANFEIYNEPETALILGSLGAQR